MYFKRLEIVGFKSFLNKTKLKFEPGVTAVVGPNGCGKSNIVDAIKWVLGEQSVKSMRGASMQDVIFNGTDRHDPVNVAEVSLTLSNEDRILPVDYDEVTISRRLYRSGESEYLLNKMPVRLTDVRDLLRGTGLGTSSYSIVEQGKIDMILSSKPEERRYIFEEASGITRYKSKKREALLKLERTKENLTRLSDIIREVERQINSIERKARKAERYNTRYEELKDLEVKLSCRKCRELGADDVLLSTETRDLRQLAGRLSSQLEESAACLVRLREEYNAVFEELQESQNEITRLSSGIDKNRHIIGVSKERVQELQKYVERLDREIEETTGRKEGLRSRLDGLEVRFSEVSKKRLNKDDELASAEEKVRIITGNLQKYENELRSNREKTVDMASRQTKTKNTLIRTNADIRNTLSREKRLKLERRGVEKEKAGASEELIRVKEEAETVDMELQNKRNEFNVFNDEYASNQRKLLLLNDEKREKEKRLNEIKPRRQFMERLVSEREGINESVKQIMKHVEAGDPRFSGVHGILSELINVRQDYEESMESVLGGIAQALIVNNRGVMDSVVSYLAANSMESVNFIILEELKKLLENGKSSVITKGMLDDITHVLSSKEPYHSALRVLLRDTFVTVSSEAARIFMDEDNDFNGRIIGEKGEIYRRGMRRSRNYSVKDVIPLFGRREKVEQMRAEEERITGEMENVSAGIEEVEKWLKDTVIKKEKLESELRQRQMEFADISSRKAVVKEKFDSLVEELFLLDTEIKEEGATLRELQDERQRLEQTLEELDAENNRLQQTIEETQNAIREGSREREETLFRMSDIKAELSAFRKDEENLAENLEREREICQRLDREVEEKTNRIAESTKRIKKLGEEMRTLEERNLEYASLEEVRNSEILAKRQRKERLAEEVRGEEKKVKQKEQELEDVRDKTRNLDIRAKEVEYKSRALVEKIKDTYNVDIAGLEVEIEENMDWEQAVKRINELKEQLERMGEVSLGAVEEHKQLEERYQFLTGQKEDLVNGREALMQAISRINRTTRKMFMETFERIRKEFNDYFRMLFNGGKAELLLQDESDVLECGIDIAIRPPGKKPHNIMQLSGGEKAMTAVALIFAIFKVNPSPFCVLDEMDAPLDESNIVRFCRVLQEFLKLSQFVIVTHNRMTIQLADILYGITMEEKGVSKIVSVKFTEDKEVSDIEAVPAAV
ncbi:MAG: chromosome segregation protein SMC [Candidatus Makaraimicrobium thalassicum]|nr:MAG: chromosome segregation protein SMC [Candidatus Omnitrophota bacterium]